MNCNERKRMKGVISLAIILLAGCSLSGQTLTLDSCRALVKQNNAQIQNARLDVEHAQQVKKEAFTKYFPKVSATALGYYALSPLVEYGIEDVDNAMAREWLHNFYAETGNAMGLPNSIALCEKGVSIGATALQPVFMGGQIVNGNKLAQVGVDAAELQSQLTEQQVMLQMEQCYWLVVSLQEKQQTVNQALQLLDTLYRDVQTAVAAGLTTSNDLLKVTMKRNELLSSKLQLDNGVELAQRALCQLIGTSYAPELKLADTVMEVSTAGFDRSNLDGALMQRKEVALLDLQVRAEQLKRKMTVGATLPQVMVGAGTAYGNLIFDKFTHNTLGFAMVQVPITDWWSTSCKLKQHDVAIQKAENERRDLTEKMSLEMQQALNNVEESRQQVLLAQSGVAYAQQNLSTVQINYEAGMVSISDLLEAQTLYRQALDQLTDARIDYRLKMVKRDMLVK